jgi:hypothetical protein
MILEKIKVLDFFGSKFTFSIFNQKNFKTLFGGLTSIFSVLIIIIFGYFFGQDFFYKKNPKIIQQIVYPKEYLESTNLTAKNFVIPWRISDSFNTLNHQDIFHVGINYYKYINNATGSVEVQYEKIKYEKCNSNNSQVSEFNDNFNISNFYCINWENANYSLGGFWDGPFVNYFYISLSFCENSEFFKSSVKCTNLEKTINFFKNRDIYFELFYPEVYFVPDDLIQPMRIFYKTYYFKLSLSNLKIDRLFFSQFHIYDDRGWIFEDNEITKSLGGTEITTEASLIDYERDYGKEGKQSEIYQLFFYSKKNYILYKRNFMKFQDFAATIGGFIKIIMLIGSLLSEIVNEILLYNKIYSYFFYYDKKEEKLNRKNLKIFPFNMLNKNKSSNFENKDKNILKSEILKLGEEIKGKNDKKINSSEINLKELENKPDPNLNNYKIMNRESTSLNLSLNKVTSWNSGLIYSLKKNCSKYFLSEKEKANDLIVKYFENRLDVIYYLKFVEKMEILNSLKFHRNQMNALNFIEKKNLWEKKNIKALEDESDAYTDDKKQEIYEYFGNKKESNSLDEIDKIILNLIKIEKTNNQS